MRYLSLAEALVIGEAVTGIDAATLARGSRLELLESALHAPQAGFGEEDFDPGFVEKAAVLVVRIERNHALLDGNKRLAWQALTMFCAFNGHDLRVDSDEAVSTMVGIAAGELDETAVAVEVVVHGQDLVAFAGLGVAGHDGRPIKDLDGLGADPDIEPLENMAGRDRVETATDRHAGLAIHTMARDDADVEAITRQRAQRVSLEREVLRDGDVPLRDKPLVIAGSAGHQQFVELDHRLDVWDRDEMAAPEPAGLTFDDALLVTAFQAGLAEELALRV